LKAQAQLLVQLERRLAETLGRGAQERLARLLLNNSGNSLLKLGELAALAGLSVEHTCRLLKQLERRGWIRHSGRAIEILNPKALEGLL